jgi:histidyl-tRNA synthetase
MPARFTKDRAIEATRKGFVVNDGANKPSGRPKARLPRGFRDSTGVSLEYQELIVQKLARVFSNYGFERLVTPTVEFADALGKFLPDQDRPNEGVFSFRDDDGQWLVLRYDLTAPLARYVSQNFEGLAFPFRRFQTGSVFRDEKPGPGRFREFLQFDADTVGSGSMAADAEICMLVADALEALDIRREDYVIKINNRKILNGILELVGVSAGAEGDVGRLRILRAMDKLDRLGREGVAQLLTGGRTDPSGDRTEGAGLTADQADRILAFLDAGAGDGARAVDVLGQLVQGSSVGEEGVAELVQIESMLRAAGYGEDRARIDPSVVRGLEYYTGPVFEAELTFDTEGEDGLPVRFGSVGGGGRYDYLVERFLGRKVPATGFSIGVSRLVAALELKNLLPRDTVAGPVVVLVLDRGRLEGYQAMTAELRNAGIRAELYLGESGMRAQLKYADKRSAPVVVIEGDDERGRGEVTLKNMALGSELSREIQSREEWAKGAQTQSTVKRGDLVAEVGRMLDSARGVG